TFKEDGIMITTIRNACFDHMRHTKIMRSSHKEILYLSDHGSDENCFQFKNEMITMKLVYELLEKLPPACKNVLELYVYGLDTKEIAAKLDLSRQTIRNQKSNAINILKEGISRHLNTRNRLLN
ncbi:sigma-70 family RNA polymerase sigma factor, partial [Pedobacter sp.]|uniref:RNA polymerase sigma factor n=1 Tax=Pedobacter sp. TaxID=1411316 RepID=UPI002C238940